MPFITVVANVALDGRWEKTQNGIFCTTCFLGNHKMADEVHVEERIDGEASAEKIKRIKVN